jgi:hypothetical protein
VPSSFQRQPTPKKADVKKKIHDSRPAGDDYNVPTKKQQQKKEKVQIAQSDKENRGSKKLKRIKKRAAEALKRNIDAALQKLKNFDITPLVSTAEHLFNTTKEGVSEDVYELLAVCYMILKVVNIARETFTRMTQIKDPYPEKKKKPSASDIPFKDWVDVDYDKLLQAFNIMGELKAKELSSYGEFKKIRKFAVEYSLYRESNNKYMADTIRRLVKCIFPILHNNGKKTVLLFPSGARDRCIYTPAKEQVYRVSLKRQYFKSSMLVETPYDDLVFITAVIFERYPRERDFSWVCCDALWKPVRLGEKGRPYIVNSQPILTYGYVDPVGAPKDKEDKPICAEVTWPLSCYMTLKQFSILGGLDANRDQRIMDYRVLLIGHIFGIVLPVMVGIYLVMLWRDQLMAPADFLAAMGLYATWVITTWQTIFPTLTASGILTYDYKSLVTQTVRVTSVEQLKWCLGIDIITALVVLGTGVRWQTPTFTSDFWWACWHDGQPKPDGIHNLGRYSRWWKTNLHGAGLVKLNDLMKIGYVPYGINGVPSALSDGSGKLDGIEHYKESHFDDYYAEILSPEDYDWEDDFANTFSNAFETPDGGDLHNVDESQEPKQVVSKRKDTSDASTDPIVVKPEELPWFRPLSKAGTDYFHFAASVITTRSLEVGDDSHPQIQWDDRHKIGYL